MSEASYHLIQRLQAASDLAQKQHCFGVIIAIADAKAEIARLRRLCVDRGINPDSTTEIKDKP